MNNELSPTTVGIGGLPTDEGWYVAHHPKNNWTEIIFVRLDTNKQEYVVDAVGHERRYSEDLWRYKEWVFSKVLVLSGWEDIPKEF